MRRVAAALAAALSMPLAAFAARPMITDDARIVDAKACQLESWTRREMDSTEYWALPACNPTGNLEITFGGARTDVDEGTHFTDELLQAKTLFRTLDAGGVAWGVAAGTVRHPHRAANTGWPGDPYFYVPASLALSDRWIMHVNLGAARRRDEGRTVATWGVGHEIQVRPDVFLIPEVFHSDPGRPSFQLGLRYWLVKDFLQVDATYGSRFVSDADARWFSIGVRVLTRPFLP